MSMSLTKRYEIDKNFKYAMENTYMMFDYFYINVNTF